MDCVITKLKGTATNSNLLPLGYVSATVDFTSSQSVANINLRWSSGGNVLKLTGSAVFTNSEGSSDLGQSITLGANQTHTIYIKDAVAEKVKLLIPIYNLIRYNTDGVIADSKLTIDIKSFKYSSVLGINGYFEGSTSIVGALPDTLSSFVINGDGYLKATTAEIGAYPNIYDLRAGGMDISGDIVELAPLKKATILRPNGARATNTPYGEVNDLIRGMIANGRDSGSCAMRFIISDRIKLAGSAITSADVAVTFTSATQYTVTNGSNSYTYVKSGDSWVLQS